MADKPHRISIHPAIETDIAMPLQRSKSVRIGPAVETDIAMPVSATVSIPWESLQAVVTPPGSEATPAERRQWLEDEAFILTWAGTAAALGGLLGGRAWGVASAFIGGMYAAIKTTRRS